MQRWAVSCVLLICSVILSGCGPRVTPELYIYCNETFWYVMQEEALLFNKIYGFQVILIPIRASRTSETTNNTLEIGNERLAPAPWLSMPGSHTTDFQTPHTRINTNIELQIESIASSHLGDLFLSDSQKHLEKLKKLALSVNEFPVCYLTLTMLVPKGNPHHLRSAQEVLASNQKLGIVNPSLDGLGMSSWIMLSKIVSGGESAIPMEFVQCFERQYDLLEALEQGSIDAALVWNATSLANFLLIKYADEYNEEYEDFIREAEQKDDGDDLLHVLQTMCEILIEEKSFAEEVPLTENPGERYVVPVKLVALGSANNYGYCERFADFMHSNMGKEVLRRFGFVPK